MCYTTSCSVTHRLIPAAKPLAGPRAAIGRVLHAYHVDLRPWFGRGGCPKGRLEDVARQRTQLRPICYHVVVGRPADLAVLRSLLGCLLRSGLGRNLPIPNPKIVDLRSSDLPI